ncbi:hypothetical protein PMAYCL1PPCAC_33029, partial [Pristionchus mayeri]
GWIMGVVILLDVMMERVFAFWRCQTYDDQSNACPRAAAGLLVTEYILFGFLGFTVTQNWISFDLFVLLLFSVSIITYLVSESNKSLFQIFPISQWILMKRIKKREQDRFEIRMYNVNGRFQIHDLKRSMHMLRNYVFFQGFSWFIAVTVASYFQFAILPAHPDYGMLAEQLGYLINSPRAIVSMMIPMTYHNGIRQTILHMLKKR